MNAADVPAIVGAELKRRKYFVRMDVLEQTLSLVKVRLYISPDLFVQVYRNDRYQTTNLALIYNGRWLFARDELDGRCHRHTHETPESMLAAGRAAGRLTLLNSWTKWRRCWPG